MGILRGDGLGGFASAPAAPVGRGPEAVAAGDLNGDGAVDLVVANTLDDSLSILISDGLGGFVSDTIEAIGVSPVAVTVANLDEDGNEYADVAVVLRGLAS